MTVTKKLIGRLPILIGEYDSTKAYSKRQRVTLYGSEFESKVDNNTTAPATLTNDTLTINTNNWMVVSNGTEAFLAGEKIKHFNEEDNPEFVSVNSDSDGKLLESTDTKGNKVFYADVEIKGNINCNSLTSEIKKTLGNKVDKEEGKSLIDENIINSISLEDENSEYASVVLDNEDKIFGGIKKNGTLEWNSIQSKSFDDLPNNWSNASSIHIPLPRCAKANIIGTLPTRKGITTNGEIQFWDYNGNYFQKYVNIDIHGRTSAFFKKKNYTIDFFNDKKHSEEFPIKFGDWVEMDSFYFQGWYSDAFRGMDIFAYKLYQQIIDSRGPLKNKPYKYSLFENSNIDTDNPNIDIDFTSNALTTPMGFPIILYLNNEFWGIYTVMLKKNRSNFLMGKSDYKAVMLDLDNGNIVNGIIDWKSFEIRNPKKLICADGTTYDGDYPKELIDETSSNYDSSNKNMRNTIITKNIIKGLANAYTEVKTAIDSNKTNDEIKAIIEKHYNVDYIIDYIIFTNLIQNIDGWGGNWQWTTWDGVIWNPNPYDLNASFGVDPRGNTCSEPNSNIQNWGPATFIKKYYNSDIESRYAYLRNKNIISFENIGSLIIDWVNSIGSENYKLEFKKWFTTPSYRNSNLNKEYWKRTSYDFDLATYDKAASYAVNAIVYFNGKVYKSIIDNNQGNIPDISNSQWKVVTYSDNVNYSVGDVVYMSLSNIDNMTFQCIKNCINVPPLSATYDESYGLFGFHDSISRILNWTNNKIILMDKSFNYINNG